MRDIDSPAMNHFSRSLACSRNSNARVVVARPTGGLAQLGVARANALQTKTSSGADADLARARAAYKDLLTLCEGADPDILIYQPAKAEYAKLK